MKEEIGEGLEELLYRLRKEKNWTYDDLLMHIDDLTIDQDDIKKWEAGLNYPDLNMMYKLSELYRVPIEEFVKAKDNSFAKGMNSIHMKIIKWMNYAFGISLKVSIVLVTIFYAIALVGSFLFFMSATSSFRGS
jgi:transcriptional regulator with XRE-family HTH domain